MQTELSATLGVSQDQTLIEVDNKRRVMVLNDQGGQQMAVSKDVTGTIRAQEHGHQPCVMSFNSKQMGLDTVGALCAVDYKGAGNQYVNDGKLVIQHHK